MRPRMFYWSHPDILAVRGREVNSPRREVLAQPPGASFRHDVGWHKIGDLERVARGWRTACCGRVFSTQRDAAAHVAWSATSNCEEALATEMSARTQAYRRADTNREERQA